MKDDFVGTRRIVCYSILGNFMHCKFKMGLFLASVFCVCAVHADEIKQDIYQVQVLKNGASFLSPAILLSTEGHWAETSQYTRKDQLKMECNGTVASLMQSIERSRGALVAARRDANIIKASLTIKDVEQQSLPANGYFEKCIPVTPNEQTTSKFDLEFVVTDPAKAEFTKDLGNGYSVVLKASQLVQ